MIVIVFRENNSKIHTMLAKSRLYGLSGSPDGFETILGKIHTEHLKDRWPKLLLQIVGNVELGLVFVCSPFTEVADGEVGQPGHAVDFGVPKAGGIAIGDDDDVTSLQRLQFFRSDSSLVACCYPQHCGVC